MYQYRSDEIAEHTDSLAYYRRRACCNRQRHIRRLHIVHPRAPQKECSDCFFSQNYR